MKLAGADIGPDRPLFLIAGPCVVESPQLTLDIAGELKEITGSLGVPFVFKASYDKALVGAAALFAGGFVYRWSGEEERYLARFRAEVALSHADFVKRDTRARAQELRHSPTGDLPCRLPHQDRAADRVARGDRRGSP